MQLNKTREELVKMYIESLKEEQLPWKKGWLDCYSINGRSNQRYRGINQLLLNMKIAQENYKDNRWYTYNQIQDMGLKLKDAKGKGVPVEFWSAYNYKTKERMNFNDYESYLKYHPDEKENFKFIVRTAIVFNGDLIEGLEPSNQIIGSEIRPLNEIVNIIKSLNVKYNELGTSAFYNPETDTITLPPKEKFKDEYLYYSTQLHELCHSTGNASRLSRNIENLFGTKDYAKEELIAEISSSFLMNDFNIPASTQHYNNHKAYIQSWIKLLEDRPSELFKAINESTKVVNYIGNYLYKNKDLDDNMAESLTLSSDKNDDIDIG